MTQPPSHRITPLGAASLVALSQLTAAHVARAQTQGDITVSISEIADGDTVLWSSGDEDYLRPFNREHCETSDTITATVTLQNLPSGTTFVDLWVGRSGVDCSTTDARQTGDSRQCVHLDADPSVHTLDGTILVSLSELLDPDDDACESSPADGETFYLWILATGSTESTGTVTSDEFGYVTFTIDASPPSAPTAEGDTNVSGDNAIPIEWSYGSEANLEYNVYLDTSVTDCSETGVHAAGEEASGTPIATGISGTRYNVPAGNLGLGFGESAQVFVTTVDTALNESVLSTAYCITRIEVYGFCDALAANGIECTQSCTVGRPYPAGDRSANSGSALLAIGVLVGARRRRRFRRRGSHVAAAKGDGGMGGQDETRPTRAEVHELPRDPSEAWMSAREIDTASRNNSPRNRKRPTTSAMSGARCEMLVGVSGTPTRL